MFILFSLTLLCVYFIFAYPAVRLFYFHLPCCAIIFLRTCPAVLLFFYALTYPLWIPPRRKVPPYLYIATPDVFQLSKAPYLHVPLPVTCLHASISPYLHVPTPAARLQTSMPYVHSLRCVISVLSS